MRKGFRRERNIRGLIDVITNKPSLENEQRMMSLMWRRVKKSVRLAGVIACLVTSGLAMASEYHGQVTFNGLPVPGVTVTATQGKQDGRRRVR